MAKKNNAKNASIARPKIGGAVFAAPVGTALPDSATAELNDAFVCLGCLSEDGYSIETESDSEDLKDSDGDVMDVSSSKRTETVNMAFLEVMNPDVLKVVYGDDVAVDEATGAISFPHGKEPADRSYVCDSILKGNRIDRLVLPQGRISEMDTVAFKKGELKTLPVTIKAISDEEGNPSYEYISGTTAAA